MASNRVLAKSINMPFLQSNNKFIYVSLEYNPYPFIIRTLSGFPDFEVTT